MRVRHQPVSLEVLGGKLCDRASTGTLEDAISRRPNVLERTCIVNMTDEQDGRDASLVKRKLTKRERFRGAVQRGVSKVKKSDEESTRDGEFTLNDDVKDFLTFRSPYSKPAMVPPSTPDSQRHDTSPSTPPSSKTDIDDFLHKTDPSDVLPHFPTPSRDPLPVPRIDVNKSPRFPHARDLLGEDDNADRAFALRMQDDSGNPPRRKARRQGLAVRFSDGPPIIIGEGGDDAEEPTIYLLDTIARSRSRSDAPMPEPQQYLGQVPSLQIPRKPVPSPTRHISPPHILPQSLQSMEFDMTLMPGSLQEHVPTQDSPVKVADAPASRTRRLRMRAEEGKTLRESFHESSFGSVFD
jgi:hypothetical protein